ncbi:serine hydrolase [Camelimonas fluminis]|uniref:Serine hydrolase domain-containing protein n=1 Tax=Camelimonas fluminis TaxID=1576911 RepID=A0ABV7UKV0_9HYPH|nr:serine hydrolase domain-containing protein [Camelimonas fluminis]GHE75737.1 serine hydrolase [Camelimonas fluminis]
MVKPETVGMSAARLERLDQVMKHRYVDGGYLPGFITQVYRNGELAHTGIVGSMDLERGRPMQEDAIFRIYSMTKPVIGVALMIAVEEGLVGLDDDVHNHIPSFKELGVYQSAMPTLLPNQPQQFIIRRPERHMKVIDLATHTSGLTYGFLRRTAVDQAYRKENVNAFDTPGGLQGMIDQLSRLPLEFSPGTQWNYSVGMDVLGYIIQQAYGMPLGEVLRRKLFEPLGMKDTHFYIPSGEIGRFTSCYQPGAGGKGLKLQDDGQKSTYAEPPLLEAGGGGLVSTTHDYMRMCRMLANRGNLDGVQILSPKSIQLFSLNHLEGGRELADMAPPGMFSEAGYAGQGFSICTGVNIDVAKTRLPGTLGEFFWGGAASTAFWVDPKEELAVVFMTQVIGTDARLTLRRDLRTLTYSAMTESYA